MTDVGSTFRHAGNLRQPAVGGGSSSIGSTIFVLNSDAKTISGSTTLATDPYHIVYAKDTAAWRANVTPVDVPDMGYWLEINIAYWGSAPTADLPVVAVYGRVPAANSIRRWPQDVVAAITPTSVSGTAHDTDFWVPLIDWDSHEYQTDEKDVDASNLLGLNPSAVVALDSDGADTEGIRMGVPRRVYIAGCDQVICSIHTVADNADAALIVGRFIG
tara:strand:+ start:44 stop:694 length:651 start_codon:yes stop_codon:yes gene_type:complete